MMNAVWTLYQTLLYYAHTPRSSHPHLPLSVQSPFQEGSSAAITSAHSPHPSSGWTWSDSLQLFELLLRAARVVDRCSRQDLGKCATRTFSTCSTGSCHKWLILFHPRSCSLASRFPGEVPSPLLCLPQCTVASLPTLSASIVPSSSSSPWTWLDPLKLWLL